MEFGPFRLEIGRRRLTRAGVPVPLKSRALDLLITLVGRAGEVISRPELLAEVWPGLRVDDTNLRTQISQLRRVLGDVDGETYIATVPVRGYSFVAPLTRVAERPHGLAVHRAPRLQTRVVGREAPVRALAARLRDTRLITVTGAGGIGKTTLALALAAEVEQAYDDGVLLVDLADAADPAVAVAAALGLSLAANDATAGITAHLAQLKMLLVFDGCERRISDAAQLATHIIEHAPGVAVVATSREVLRAPGELVWRLEPLAIPSAERDLDAASALAYAAVELFADRARSVMGGFVLNDDDAPLVAGICRRLDGLPLAIELAAGRLPAFGVRGLHDALEDRLKLLSQGLRTAPPRHQTIQAAIDWSYEALSPVEQATLRRLSLFVGPFTLGGAAAVAGGSDLQARDVTYVLADLVSKSLVAGQVTSGSMTYAILDTTREYASTKLDGVERAAAARRHARFTMERLSQADAELAQRSKQDWIGHFGRQLSNLTAALEWAYGPDGDPSDAVEATLAGAPVWVRLSRYDDSARWCRKALELVDPASREAMHLQAELGNALFADPGATEEVVAAWEEAARLAAQHGEAAMLLRAQWGLWNAYAYHGRMLEAGPLARRLVEMAAQHGGEFERAAADRVLAASLSLEGDHASAQLAAERVLAATPAAGTRAPIGWHSFHPRIMALNTLVTCWWTQGDFRRAAEMSATAAREALESDHDFSICAVLADNACPIHLLLGRLDAAGSYTELLHERARRSGLVLYMRWAEAFNAVLAAVQGDARPGLSLLESDRMRETGHPRYLLPLAILAHGLGQAGHASAARRLADELLVRARSSGQRWILPELQRVRGELSAESGEALDLLRSAVHDAMEQGAPAWALRAALSLHRFDPSDSERRLGTLLAQFESAHDTPELLAARRLLRMS